MKKSIEQILKKALNGREIYVHQRTIKYDRFKHVEYLLQEPKSNQLPKEASVSIKKIIGTVKDVVCHTEEYESDSIIIKLDIDDKEVKVVTYSLTEIIEFKKNGK